MSDTVNIDKLDEKALVQAYEVILSAEEEALVASLDVKEAEKKLQDDICQKKQYYKKDGTTLDTGKVKLGTFKKAMEVHLGGGQNKLEAELILQEEYIAEMKNDRGIMDKAKALQNKMRNAKEAKGSAKDTTEELKTQFDSEIVDALALLVQMEIKNKKEAFEADDGKSSKPKKDKSGLADIAKLLKKKMKK